MAGDEAPPSEALATNDDDDDDGGGEITIRPLRKEDEATVAELWLKGLSQTSESISFPLLRPYVDNKMNKYAAMATSETGDVGPKGCNLMEKWSNKKDRVMLVACMRLLVDDDNKKEVVVGSVGVKKGLGYGDDEEIDSTEASIWRMSVSSQVRRQGLGQKLMQAAEAHAKNEYGCTGMGLWTANTIAAKFYSVKCGFHLVEGKGNWYDAISPFPKVSQYKKDLVSTP
jgi:ribosomal protein S18 acetylase RimI-like enzyme